MPTPTAVLVTRLQAAADAAIAKMLASRQAPATATLSDIERSARLAGREVEQAIAAALAAESAAEWTAPPVCTECKKK